jgi:hypothetical protein
MGFSLRSYSKNHPTFNCIPVTPNLIGSYETDRKFRAQFQTWLNQIWKQKDNHIASIDDATNTNSQPNRSS